MYVPLVIDVWALAMPGTLQFWLSSSRDYPLGSKGDWARVEYGM